MNKHANIQAKDSQFILSGELSFANVMVVYQQSFSLFANAPELHIDFDGLKSNDSSGLALMIEWLKYAESQHKPIYFHRIPPYLMALIQVSGLNKLIQSVSETVHSVA
jgi:phospholipid transport system transporter-binding protein